MPGKVDSRSLAHLAVNLSAKCVDALRHWLEDFLHSYTREFGNVGCLQDFRQLREQRAPLLICFLKQLRLHPEIALWASIEHRLEFALKRRAVRKQPQNCRLDGIGQCRWCGCHFALSGEPCLLEDAAITV